MLNLFLDTLTREWFDAAGDLFANRFPKLPLGNIERINISCGSFKFDENTGNREFVPDSSFNLKNTSALLSIDNNFTRHIKGSLAEDLPAGDVNSIKLNISNATRGKIPANGAVRLFNNAGDIESIEYTSRNISGNTVEFICANNSTLKSSYAKNANADCPESLYAQAALNTQESDLSEGIFVFDLTVDSEKLREKADYADIEYISDVKGMELLIFGVAENDKIVTYNSFLCDTVSIPVPMADPNPNPQMPDTYTDNVAAIAGALLSRGLDVESRNNNGNSEVRIKLASTGNDAWSDWVELDVTVSGGTEITEQQKEELLDELEDRLLNGEWGTV